MKRSNWSSFFDSHASFVVWLASILLFQYPGYAHGCAEYQHNRYNNAKDGWKVIILLGVKAIACNRIDDDVCDTISISVLEIKVNIKEPG